MASGMDFHSAEQWSWSEREHESDNRQSTVEGGAGKALLDSRLNPLKWSHISSWPHLQKCCQSFVPFSLNTDEYWRPKVISQQPRGPSGRVYITNLSRWRSSTCCVRFGGGTSVKVSASGHMGRWSRHCLTPASGQTAPRAEREEGRGLLSRLEAVRVERWRFYKVTVVL